MPPSETPPRTWGRRRVTQGSTSPPRKHPHARGEDQAATGAGKTIMETPPRTWGRLPQEKQEELCSETPPRTWGRPSDAGSSERLLRNTPTHVGKTELNNGVNNNLEKHPHARGEDFGPPGIAPEQCETPPRTWGRQAQGVQQHAAGGNTPTHVGKTAARRARAPGLEKHPHARGEDPEVWRSGMGWWETPPRTWGRLLLPVESFTSLRNTPTHVGKTLRWDISGRRRQKHPHARGEDSIKSYKNVES